MGVGDTFTATPVGCSSVSMARSNPVRRSRTRSSAVGPARTGCIECGECMTGCRHGAKNTLVKNYLGLAERPAHKLFR